MTGRSVLLVDDDADIRDAVEAILTDHGWKVTTCADGLEAARQLVGGLRPAVILLDLMMPRVDGLWFRDMQLRDPALARIPVVVITAFSDLAADSKELLAGVRVVNKPFDADSILRAVEGASS
jgi:CheY-like chemotaxis protein